MLNKIKCKIFRHPLFRLSSCPFTMKSYLICEKCGYTKEENA